MWASVCTRTFFPPDIEIISLKTPVMYSVRWLMSLRMRQRWLTGDLLLQLWMNIVVHPKVLWWGKHPGPLQMRRFVLTHLSVRLFSIQTIFCVCVWLDLPLNHRLLIWAALKIFPALAHQWQPRPLPGVLSASKVFYFRWIHLTRNIFPLYSTTLHQDWLLTLKSLQFRLGPDSSVKVLLDHVIELWALFSPLNKTA